MSKHYYINIYDISHALCRIQLVGTAKKILKCLTLLMKVYTLLRHGVKLSTSVTSRLNFQNYLCHDYSRKLEIKQ